MPHLIFTIFSFFLALAITHISIPSIVKLSKQKHLFDEPNVRGSSSVVVPTLGGLGIFAGFVISLFLNPFTASWVSLPSTVASLMILVFMGLKDDLLDISPKKKLYSQFISALILVVFADIRVTNLHGFLGITDIPLWFGAPLTVFVMIVFTNSFNLIDGIDGLASGLTIFISSLLGVWFFLVGQIEYCTLCFALSGALMSFFYYNVFGKKNKLFMGDTGSLLIGMLMAVLIVKFNEFNIDATGPFAIDSAPAISFGLLIYPLFDTVRVFTIRLAQKRSPFRADKNHIHHRLLALGYSHKRSTCIIISINALFIFPLYFIQDLGISMVMIYNMVVAFCFSCVPAVKIINRDLIQHNDPHQQILYPKKEDIQKLAMEAIKIKGEDKTALVRALERINIF